MMLFREEYYEPDNPDVKGMAEVLVRKHRNGPVGELKFKWEGQYGRFGRWEGPPVHPLDPGPDSPPPVQPTPIGGGKPKNFAPN